jgi:hypothetical protein
MAMANWLRKRDVDEGCTLAEVRASYSVTLAGGD